MFRLDDDRDAGHDPLGRAASWRDGARSVAVGIAGNRSLATGQAVPIADVLRDGTLPERP